MIKKATVFVLGASASLPYGYPSGETLVTEIVDELQSKASLFELCRQLEFTERDIISFAESLNRSGDKSIDAFLERNAGFIRLGKIAITLKLIEKEDEDFLFSPGDDKWYGHLVNELKSASVETFSNNVSFLTFNYDRSFDHYLFNSIMSSYEEIKDSAMCAEMVKKIPLIHLHGQIGKLPWQECQGIDRPYSKSTPSSDLLKRALLAGVDWIDLSQARHFMFDISNQIKIIHEKELDNDSGFQEAKKLLSKANNIYFLGFGYHDDNLRRLNIAGLSPAVKRHIDGTSYGVGAAKKRHINSVTKGKINLSDRNYKIIEFLKESVDFE